MARAELQGSRLRSPLDALASLRAALAIDPTHPGAREALLAQLDAAGDARALRDALVELAAGESTAEGRARVLGMAAEIDELELMDDPGAADLYARATSATPADEWLEERRSRVLLRLGRSTTQAAPRGDSARGQEEISGEAASVAALRALEQSARAAGALPRLAEVLAQQADSFAATAPKLAALWARAALVQWKLADDDDRAVVDSIRQHAPTDRAAVDAALRRAIPGFRNGDADARARATSAQRALLELAANEDGTDRLCAFLAAGLALEREAIARDDDDRAALGCYREALRIDPLSVLAASGTARLAAALDDAEAMIAAAIAQAELAPEPKQRAASLVGAAGRLVSALDPRLGGRPERLARAGDLLERALEADPEAIAAAGLLVAVRSEDGQRDRLLRSLRAAFDRAQSRSAIARFGSEVARVAAADAADRGLAIEALRRVLTVEPGNSATLRALADLYAAQRAWGEVAETLETLASNARDAGVKLAAAFELADLYGRVLARPADAQRTLRLALEIDPTSVEALRRLLAQARASGAAPQELATLLARLGDAETDPEPKSAALTELAQIRRSAGDVAGAEHALVEALAQAPTEARLAIALELRGQAAEQARLLDAVVRRAQALDRPDASCLAALGRIEVEALGRQADGVAHLRSAIALAPAMREARAVLASGLLGMGVAGEAVALLLPMILSEAGTLLALTDPARALATLETALAADARQEEAIVARELRALCGGLDDGDHAMLRARRLAVDANAAPVAVLGAQLLRTSVVPREADSLLLDLAAALAGAEVKIGQLRPVSGDEGRASNDRPDALHVTARGRLAPSSGHPALALLQRLSAMFGVAKPEIAVGERGAFPRLVVIQDAPWIAVPAVLLDLPEPDLAASLVPLFARLALSVPWLDDLRGVEAHALLCGAARLVVPGYAAQVVGAEQTSRIDEMARRVGKAIGRKQKKALSELAPALGATPPPTLADVAAWEHALRCTEVRAAFVATGDLLATIGAARTRHDDLARATVQFGPAAVSATLAHPVAGDVVRFALAPATTALRWRAGTLWKQPR
jgi:tetratricopeptide (TPR) repeat protein